MFSTKHREMVAGMKRVVVPAALAVMVLAALAVMVLAALAVVMSGGGVNQYRAYQASDLDASTKACRA